MKYCVDLCTGLGGFSQAFQNDPEWKIITVDIDPKFNPTVCADITKIDWLEFKKTYLEDKSPDVLLASPPCTHFSIADMSSFPKKGVQKAFEIVGACFEAVVCLKPKRYLIENPKGLLRCFVPIKPKQTIRYSDFSDYPTQKPTDLWGNIPLPMVKMIRRPHSPSGKNLIRNVFNTAEERAKVPLGVSSAVREGIELMCVANDKMVEK